MRAGATDDYEILISKVNNRAPKLTTQEEGKTGSGRNPNDNLRANFASPSPDIGPNATRNINSSADSQVKHSSGHSKTQNIQTSNETKE